MRSSIEKARNTSSIPALFLNQNASISCNLTVKISHLEVGRVYSIDDLAKAPQQTTHWNGVRNYQVRNMLRDDMRVGDQAFFYYSNCATPGIVGIMEIVRAGYPDDSAWDKKSPYYDPKSTPTKPQWFMVDVKFKQKFARVLSLAELKAHPLLAKMQVARKGNRLSITPVTAEEWGVVVRLVSG